MSARENILSRLRTANRGVLNESGSSEDNVASYIRAQASGPIPGLQGEPVARFCERARGLSSTIAETDTTDAVPQLVAEYLRENGLLVNAVCWQELSDLEWEDAGLSVDVRPAIETDMVGITSAFCGIAETGTLILLSAADTPSTTSLLPETHIAVLRTSRIVSTLEDAWRLLRDEHGEMPRSVNLISGPSRTADIEQTLVLGAHGPYRVHILLVGS